MRHDDARTIARAAREDGFAMTRETESATWDEALRRLKSAAAELQTAATRTDTASGDQAAAREQLRHDVSRLEQSASALLTKLQRDLDAKRSGIEESVDRERAERSVDQLRASLDELTVLAGAVAVDVTGAVTESLRQAEPELKTALRTLDDVLGSAAAWVKATVDPDRDQKGGLVSEGRPPLDDL
jgi:hypothetical protein